MAFAFLNSQLRCANTHLDMKRTIHTVTHGITCMQSEWDLLPNDNLRFELNSFPFMIKVIVFYSVKWNNKKSSNNYIQVKTKTLISKIDVLWEGHKNLKKSTYIVTTNRGSFLQILWPSQNIWISTILLYVICNMLQFQIPIQYYRKLKTILESNLRQLWILWLCHH